MQRSELQQHLEEARTQIERQLAGLSQEQMLYHEAPEAWSVRDLIAHLNFWEQTGLENLHRFLHSEPGVLVSGETDAINAQVYAANQLRPPSLVIEEFNRTHANLVAAIEHFSDADLSDRIVFDREPLWEYIWGESGEHFLEHLDDLKEKVTAAKAHA